MDWSRSGRAVFLVVLAVAVLTAGVVAAQEVAGVRVELNSITGNTVSFDVVEFTDADGSSPTRQLSNPLEFGDGNSVNSPAVTRTAGSYAGFPAITGVYRGTFSHVYPSASTFTIRAGDCCAGWPISNTAYYITGYYTGTSDQSITVWNNLDVSTTGQPVPTSSRGILLVLAVALVVTGIGLLKRRTVFER